MEATAGDVTNLDNLNIKELISLRNKLEERIDKMSLCKEDNIRYQAKTLFTQIDDYTNDFAENSTLTVELSFENNAELVKEQVLCGMFPHDLITPRVNIRGMLEPYLAHAIKESILDAVRYHLNFGKDEAIKLTGKISRFRNAVSTWLSAYGKDRFPYE